MTDLRIGPCAPEDARPLLEASHRLMSQLFAPEENHLLSLADLKGPDVRFFGAYQGAALVGCGALALRDGFGEVKSMFVDAAARGAGVAGALLQRIEDAARSEGLAMLRLETGDKLDAALRLYARHGFTECGAFGDYPACDDASVFMEKPLASGAS